MALIPTASSTYFISQSCHLKLLNDASCTLLQLSSSSLDPKTSTTSARLIYSGVLKKKPFHIWDMEGGSLFVMATNYVNGYELSIYDAKAYN